LQITDVPYAVAKQRLVLHNVNVQLRLAVSTPTASTLCTRCETLPRCQRCKRHLPRCCSLQFDGDNVSDSSEATDKRPTAVCRACDKKRSRSTVRKSTGSVVTEIEIPTTDAVQRYFENFLRINEEQIRAHVEEHRRLHRYVKRTFANCLCFASGPFDCRL